MLNYGEKAVDWCEPKKCEAYKFVVAISNNSGTDGVLKCPKHFCDAMLNTYKCQLCKNKKSILDGRLVKNDKNQGEHFECWFCNAPTISEDKEIIDSPRVKSSENLLQQIEQYILEKTGNQKFMALYSDVSADGKYRFYNPFNPFPDPLIIDEKSYFEDVQSKLDKFFDTMVTRR